MKIKYFLGVALLSSAFQANLLSEEISFNRDIKPILSDRCFHCHGPDTESREAKLRLDVTEGKDGAYRVRKGKAAIVPGKPEESEVYKRIITKDEDDVMPPPDSHKLALSEKEIGLIKQWIKEGAKYAGHWAFEKPVKPDVPKVANSSWVKNPIDAFTLKDMEKKGFKPSPEAPRYKLIRRLSYDLNGLPPTPAEVDAFINDKSPNAYEKLVDKLLAKKDYGERMALPWLDMARYGDSSVYHADGPRTMWPWRDWVINAYNENKPFDEFTIEQLAGDHIKDRTPQQLIATAFLRNNGTTDEGGAFFEEYRVEYTVDRLVTTSKIWLGLTTECGQCHDHKYDPFSQKEFFELYAFFNVAADPGRQTRKGNQAPVANVPLPKSRLMLIDVVKGEIEELKKKKAAHLVKLKPKQEKWLADNLAKFKDKFDYTDLAHYIPYQSSYLINDVIDLSDPATRKGKEDDVRTANGRQIKKNPKDKKEKGIQTKALSFNRGNAQLTYGQKTNWINPKQPFTISFWINSSGADQYIVSKMDQKTGKGYGVFMNKKQLSFTMAANKKDKITVDAPDSLQNKKWQYITLTYDGSGKAAGVKFFVDAKEAKLKVVSDTLKGGSIENKAVFMLGSPKKKLTSPIAQLKIYKRNIEVERIAKAKEALPNAVLINEKFTSNKKVAEQIANHYYFDLDRDFQVMKKQIAGKYKQIEDYKKLNVMVMEDMKNNPRKTYILSRGAYDQPIKDEEIFPDTPNVLPPMKKEFPKNRLGLAKWIMDKDNPLTARVTVNRYWMMLFGHGLVNTPADFGNQGSWPTHPELLDWLAVDFRDNGWNVKRAIKQIVMSNTYRQDSVLSKDLLAKDKENLFYARGPRFRLTGEHIRDTALYVSGLLNKEIGGESVKPYQPPGLWNEVALTNARFVQDKGDKNFRKSMYTYYKRSAPVPNMTTFDAPTREKCVIQRSRTNTPLQALITLNDPIFVEAARFFAERIIREGGKSIDERIEFAFKNVISRKPETDIRDAVKELFNRRLAAFKKDPEECKKFLAIGSKQRDESVDLAEHAAWTVIAQLVLNLDETLNKE